MASDEPTPYESPELVELFTTYTASADSIGARVSRAGAATSVDDPLLLATASDLVLFPGRGRPPTVESFRLGARGFTELAAVSHLGPALASIVELRETYGDDAWREQAARLRDRTKAARAANSVELWRERIRVEAFLGREPAIAAMIDYSCAVAIRYLEHGLSDPASLSADTLHRDVLAGGDDRLPVPFEKVMIATFFLVGLDTGFRVLRWFDQHRIDWDRAMVVIAGQQGRPTAGVTLDTSSVAALVRGASRYELDPARILLAPHAPTAAAQGDVAGLEGPMRELWANIAGTVRLGGLMFPQHPRFRARTEVLPDLDAGEVREVGELPVIHGPDDWDALGTRLRVVLEDPRQLLSGCVTDYAVAQLVENDNDPSRVVVPGLDGTVYPRLP
ncbi:DUF5624 domain-containing protein [Microbacter sp. GSS18]|nr:DUF5624 domain-containing protein [Microbacter sp. GSS18]